MDIILNKLPNEYDKNKTLWIYEDNIPIFEKYNQFQKEIKKGIINDTIIEPITEKYNKLIIEPIIEIENIKNIDKPLKENINDITKEPLKEIKKYNKIEIKNIKKIDKPLKENIEKYNKKDNDIKKQTPINIIINQTFTANVMKNEIRQKLIDFVTEPEFSKAFGTKKAGEIVNAIVRDSWNQSIALFISFLLDATIIYKDKSYLYNKDKNKLEILIK
jgi:hypothetical protein